MQVNIVTHVTDRHITPMHIVSNDPKSVATKIIQSSDDCVGIKPDLKVEKLKSLDLDPGGMYCMKTPHIKFDIDGVTCDIQATKIDWVLEKLENIHERLPGYHRCRMWLWNIVLPTEFLLKLKAKLTELSMSDEVLHACMDEDAIFQKLEENRDLVRHVPRE